MKARLVYYIACSIAFPLSLLHLRILYVISDVLYFLVYHVIGYRLKVVRNNLRSSFPEKTDAEIKAIEKKFYSWLCDYVVEAVKLFTMSKTQMARRMRFEGVDAVHESIAKGQSCTVYLGHYCNWEWVTSLPLAVGDDGVCAQIYHPLESKGVDRFFLHLRGRMGSVSIAMTETLRHIVKLRSEGKPFVIGFIADQVPFWHSIHYWTDFLSHDTPVLSGAERIACKTNSAVYYLELSRPRRGYYVATFKRFTETPNEHPEFAITEMYFRALEKTIQDNPQFWLWSHNRWKRTRERWEERLKEAEERKQKEAEAEARQQ